MYSRLPFAFCARGRRSPGSACTRYPRSPPPPPTAAATAAHLSRVNQQHDFPAAEDARGHSAAPHPRACARPRRVDRSGRHAQHVRDVLAARAAAAAATANAAVAITTPRPRARSGRVRRGAGAAGRREPRAGQRARAPAAAAAATTGAAAAASGSAAAVRRACALRHMVDRRRPPVVALRVQHYGRRRPRPRRPEPATAANIGRRGCAAAAATATTSAISARGRQCAAATATTSAISARGRQCAAGRRRRDTAAAAAVTVIHSPVAAAAAAAAHRVRRLQPRGRQRDLVSDDHDRIGAHERRLCAAPHLRPALRARRQPRGALKRERGAGAGGGSHHGNPRGRNCKLRARSDVVDANAHAWGIGEAPERLQHDRGGCVRGAA